MLRIGPNERRGEGGHKSLYLAREGEKYLISKLSLAKKGGFTDFI